MKIAAVIGATGYVGSHIVQRLLNCGYIVRCGTRNPTQASWLTALDNATDSNLSIHQTDFNDHGPTDANQFDSLLYNCDSVFFCAGFEAQKPETITFMVQSSQQTIKSAKKNNVKAVVLTSSGGSTNPTPPLQISHKF